MRLIDELERLAGEQESPFRAQLFREDVARLRKLEALAREHGEAAAFRAAGMKLGWTAGDARTGEIADPLRELLDRFHEAARAAPSAEREEQVHRAWWALHRARMERLLGCLATPAPKPVD